MARLSPFAALMRFVESELYDLSLECQIKGLENMNTSFVLGYRTALNRVLAHSQGLYYRRYYTNVVMLDERTEETSQILLEALKKRGG